jgi:hypothetical protein
MCVYHHSAWKQHVVTSFFSAVELAKQETTTPR